MNLSNNTILITGGSTGIGYETARILMKKGNKVLICSRSHEKLNKAKTEIKGIEVFPCDISIEEDRMKLFNWVKSYFPECNILINNAAIVHKTNFSSDSEMLEKTTLEINTNLLAPIALSKLFLPLLESNSNAQLINVTTGLVFAPKAAYPIYNSTKAGLHAFTQVLRHQLKSNPIKIREVFMTVVDTPFHKGQTPKRAVSAKNAATEMVVKLESTKDEIKIGSVSMLHLMSRIAPGFAFKKINSL